MIRSSRRILEATIKKAKGNVDMAFIQGNKILTE
jgi:hypothetical protein